MRISEAAERAGATVKAVRYYERLGLVSPERAHNGYRVYDAQHVATVRELRRLAELGIPASRARPFVDCLQTGHEHADTCPSALAEYRDTIADLDARIAALRERRVRLADRLHDAAEGRTAAHGAARNDAARHGASGNDGVGMRGAEVRRAGGASADAENHAAGSDGSGGRGVRGRGARSDGDQGDETQLPSGLPVPLDDGGADHLPGLALPALSLVSTAGGSVDVSAHDKARSILYFYPLSRRPGIDLPEGWDTIPGARGCTAEACDFRDHAALLREAGVRTVHGISSQDPEYQGELVDRLGLPFSMLSDARFELADALRLPTISAPGWPRLHARLTLVVREGRIEHVFYPVFPPDRHAHQVLTWLREHPV